MVDDTTYASQNHKYLVLAQGIDGFRLMIQDTDVKQYRLLAQVKPEYNGKQIEITTINIFPGCLSCQFSAIEIICAGEGFVFLYHLEIASGSLSLAQTVDMATELSLTDYDEIVNKHSFVEILANSANQPTRIFVPLEVIRTRQ